MSEINKFNPTSPQDIAWCPGCGNFGILGVLKMALAELKLDPQKVVLCSGIGQAAKLPQYVRVNYFNGLHGRSLGPATTIKAVNPELTVIVTSGDGDLYGEGGNHFTHTIRRNPNITVLCHDNMIYGLTKGQASPTTGKGLKTPVQTTGVVLEPFNPIASAIALDASFVARASISDIEKTKEIIKQAILHKGFSLIDIFQPCVTFNKVNSYDWFKANTVYLPPTHNPRDRAAAFAEAIKTDKLGLGLFYINPDKKTFEELVGIHEKEQTPLYKRTFNRAKLQDLIGKQKPIKEYVGKITQIIDETHDVKTFVIERPNGFAYRAGQFVMLSFPDGRKVANKPAVPMTIASSPTESGVIRVTIKVMQGFTVELFKLKIGDSIRVQGPMGESFKMTEADKNNYVYLCGGTGVAPFLSLLRFIRAKEMKNKVVMINANKTYGDIICRTELDTLSKDNVFIMNTLNNYDNNWGGERGVITKEMVAKYVKNPQEFIYCLCGPPGLVNALRAMLKDLGIPDNKVKFDSWQLPSKTDTKANSQ